MIYTVSGESSSILRIRRSEFICHLFPLTGADTVSVKLKTLRKQYPKARHFCWAYRFQTEGQIGENYSDAGEPGGTAGLPMLKALRQSKLMQTGAIVVRIFGGIKLGKRGLIEAYHDAVATTIREARLIPFEERITATITGDLKYFNEYRLVLERYKGNIIADRSHSDLKWIITIPLELYQSYTETMLQRFGKKILLKREE